MEDLGLRELVGPAWARAGERRGEIPALAASLLGLEGRAFAAWREAVLSRSTSLTLLAGSGTRWQASLEAARREGGLSEAGLTFDPSLPRGLFPVANLLAPRPPLIPIAAYSLRAVSRLGSHLVVVRGHEEAIRRDILEPLGLGGPSWRFALQEAPYGKPLGHGDAAWQCRDLWRGADWLVANFGGDANSRYTLEASLLALAALAEAGEELDLLLPAAAVEEPAYPIELDGEGRPLSFGHAKLRGGMRGAGAAPGRRGLANVGLRIYRAPALAAVLEELRDSYWVPGSGYAIPGNAPGSGECALDNADALFAARGRARVLALARPGELSPAKAFEDLPRFERAMAEVLAEDGALPGAGIGPRGAASAKAGAADAGRD